MLFIGDWRKIYNKEGYVIFQKKKEGYVSKEIINVVGNKSLIKKEEKNSQENLINRYRDGTLFHIRILILYLGHTSL